MKGAMTDKVRIAHILDAISEVEKYLHSISYDTFLKNSEKRYATIKQIEIVGEACSHISKKHSKKRILRLNGSQSMVLEIFQSMSTSASTIR